MKNILKCNKKKLEVKEYAVYYGQKVEEIVIHYQIS